MEFFSQFLASYSGYLQELWLVLLVGFLISGVVNEFVPADYTERFLGSKSFKAIFIASFVGVILPVCCLGTLPIALTLRKKGASIGSVMAFLVATPATSISALIVTYRLMGKGFTIAIFLSAILVGVLLGVFANILLSSNPIHDAAENDSSQKDDCCSSGENHHLKRGKLIKILHYAFIEMPRDMGLEIALGIGIASLIASFEPIQRLIELYLTDVVGYVFVLFFGLITYVCSTASVPVADAFLHSGLSHGQALTYLLVGPITSYGTILIVRKHFGQKALNLYITIICGISVMCGIILDIIKIM